MDDKTKVNLISRAIKKNKPISFYATGNSMYPLIKNGQKVKIKPTKFSNLKVGQLIAHQQKDKIIIHQCLFKNQKYLITYGINNKFIDPPVTSKHILGIVDQSNYWQILSLIYQSEFKKIQKLAPSIRFLILKGPLWQSYLYSYQTNFPLSDMDILIDRHDFPKLKKIFTSLGYRMKSGMHIDPKLYKSKVPSVPEISFVKKLNDINIVFDIHLQAVRSALHLFNCQPICKKNMDKLTKILWKNAIYNQSTQTYFLKDEYLLLYLCLNLIFHHGLRDIKILSYLATAIDRQAINWSNFYRLTNKFNFTSFLYYPLLYTSLFFAVPTPNLKPYQPPPLKRLILKALINKHLIFRPFNCGQSLPNWFNSRLIFLIRFIINT